MTIVFYTMIMTSLMQGNILNQLNTSQNIGAIKTVEDLLDNNYKLIMTPTLSSIFKGQTGSRIREKLSEIAKTQPTVTFDAFNTLKIDKDVAALRNELFTGTFMYRFFDTTSGENLFEVIPETAFEFFTASMAPKTSPFIAKFNEIILRYLESGLYQHHLNVAFADNEVVWYQRMIKGLTPKIPSLGLRLKEVGSIFIPFLIMSPVCVLTFCLELFIHSRNCRVSIVK